MSEHFLQTAMRGMPSAHEVVILRMLWSERRRSLGKVGRVVSAWRSTKNPMVLVLLACQTVIPSYGLRYRSR